MAYSPVTSLIPPAVGFAKRLYSHDLFDPLTGAYPLVPLPAVIRYVPDANGKVPFFESARLNASGSFLATTGDDLLEGSDPGGYFAPGSDKVAREMALWALGKVSFSAGMYHYYDHTEVNMGSTIDSDYDAPGLSTPKVRIKGVTYDVLRTEWSMAPTFTIQTHTDMAPGEWREVREDYSPAVFVLQGAPNLQAAGMVVGETIELIIP